MNDLIYIAKTVAEIHHSDHKRKYTGEPYFNHLQNVADKVKEWGCPELTVIAYLHDIVEDTNFTHKDVIDVFGKEIATNVWYLTDVPLIAGNRAIRNILNNTRLAAAPETALIVKCADMIDNMKDIVEHDKKFAKVYLREIWERFSFLSYKVNQAIYDELDAEFDKVMEQLRKEEIFSQRPKPPVDKYAVIS